MGYGDIDRGHLDAIGRKIGEWLRDGGKEAYLDGEGPLPAHPELYHRMTGDGWQWTRLADTEENRQQDKMEEQAWQIWKAMHQ